MELPSNTLGHEKGVRGTIGYLTEHVTWIESSCSQCLDFLDEVALLD